MDGILQKIVMGFYRSSLLVVLIYILGRIVCLFKICSDNDDSKSRSQFCQALLGVLIITSYLLPKLSNHFIVHVFIPVHDDTVITICGPFDFLGIVFSGLFSVLASAQFVLVFLRRFIIEYLLIQIFKLCNC